MSSEYWKVLLLKFFPFHIILARKRRRFILFRRHYYFWDGQKHPETPLSSTYTLRQNSKLCSQNWTNFFSLHFGQKFKFQFFELKITTLNFRAKFDLDFTHWVKNQNWPVFWRQNSKLSQYHYFAKYGAKIQMWKSGI